MAGLSIAPRHSLIACAALLSVIAASATIPAAKRESAQPTLMPLKTCGRSLCVHDESRFRWRGVTAFALLDLVADGKLNEARGFLEWAHRAGFNVVRVLAMNPRGWFDLSAEDGRRALPDLLSLAAEYSLRVQIVALANSRGRDESFLREQVREVGRLCSKSSDCVLEIANEPYHSTQAKLNDPELMRRLQQEVPESVLVAWGAARSDTSTSLAGGDFVVVHMARGGDRWTRVARMTGLDTISRQTGKFVVDNEPIGAAERAERNRRDDDPAVFFAQGALSRVLEVGSTFHCEDCLHARIPGPIQQQAAQAFIEGSRIAPDDVVLTYVPDDSAEAPVALQPDHANRSRVFAGVAGQKGWAVVIGPDTAKLAGRAGWKPGQRVATRPGAQAWTFAR
jgi:hypothetical protein